ncbi:DNA alkylation repair protein [Candidatus Pacearchaeota archaeon]|nr:DNA alkylation repair protein [Candidatus Pacearchaeota archaeon]
MKIRQEIKSLANPEKAKVLQGFFKTGKGEYGEGDVFLGITVPESRKLAIKYSNIPLNEIQSLLDSKIHEERLIALEILTHNYEKLTSEKSKEKIVKFYLSNTHFINNWDLVDTSASYILGNFLLDKDKSILYKLSGSENIWEKRIAIIATYAFIKKFQFQDTLNIAEILLQDKHDLIQKAVGWMLREMGKKDQKILEDFLKKHYKIMPRTMLRYAIEKFPEKQRKRYLSGNI